MIDVNLLQRFDKPGPRYTSYPPAPIFSPTYTEKLFEVDLIRNNDENYDPISLYVHIPFCDTLCYFCGCTTMVTNNRSHIQRYVSALKKEIEHTAQYINKNRRVVQMHWGGGTPTFLEPNEIEVLAAFFHSHFTFRDDAEISIEIDPRGLTYEHFLALKKSGFNRISLGVQDFTEDVQRAVNRVQPEHITRQAMDWAYSVGIRNINIDLIYGLPLQTVESFQTTLDKIVELSPNRIAVFNFAYVPWMKPHQKLIHPEDMPSAETKLALLKSTIETLTNAGYEYIGMDHFAKPSDEMTVAQKEKTLHRNFQGYSTKANTDLFAFGMSSISHFGTVYAQNEKTLAEYSEAVENNRFATSVGYRMTNDDTIRKEVIMRLMCDLELSKREIEERFRISFDEYFSDALQQLEEFVLLGLIRNSYDKITIEGAGRFILRNIAMCFDAYLNKTSKQKPLYSRTV
ncbi:MAG: oxygen-independent coproporphyrinogen III oxidase [Ignavibacteriales bacterium]|nr:oxygen-independent coproporphyrinogen III oxidase [Ignavibacteriales bacterium]